MKEGWTPQQAVPEWTLSALTELCQPAFPGDRVAEARPLSGGLANANYRLRLEAHPAPLRLRLYLRDPLAAPLESAIASALRGRVAVPEVLHRAGGNRFTGHPYALLTWLEGDLLGPLLAGADPTLGRELGRAVGGALARIGQLTFPEPGLLDASLRVERRIARGGAGFLEVLGWLETPRARQRLGDLEPAYRRLVARAAALLEPLREQPARLVHSDFDPSNLLLAQVDGAWRVSGVLDWEFAHSGSPLTDLGHLLRAPAGLTPGFTDGLAEGYPLEGGVLPENWDGLARLLDLPALVDLLGRVAGPSEVASVRRALADTLARWAE